MLGGDRRQIAAARWLARRYGIIKVFGIGKSYFEGIQGIVVCEDLADCLEDADAVVLPLPAALDGYTLNSPLLEGDSPIKLASLLSHIQKKTLILGGRLPDGFVSSLRSAGHSAIDYYASEELQIKNAYTTAEAALSVAMNTLDKNIAGSRVVVTGYGRIAKHLCRLLIAIGADVTVVARDPNALLWAESVGCNTHRLDEKREALLSICSGYDVIYNTVPFWLFTREYLEKLEKNTLIIDLASAPGGVDIKAARELGTNVIWATSLPGKYAPQSAGEHIAECVDRIIKGEVGL